MDVTPVPTSKIQVGSGRRRVSEPVVAQLATDIGERGLRQPIEVARIKGGKFHLVTGAHRLAACRALGMADIPGVVIKGNGVELRRDELMENLGRNDLSTLERAQALASLKLVFQEATGARHGGDRKSADFQEGDQDATLASWYAAVASRSEAGVRTIKRLTSIGENLSPEIADRLRDTAFEDNQKELESLAKQPPELQSEIVERLLHAEEPARSVGAAIKVIRGDAVPPVTDDAEFRKLMDAWNRASGKTRKRFLQEIGVAT
jgi:ParB family transcriptional regulator, chromosome partitioning protein